MTMRRSKNKDERYVVHSTFPIWWKECKSCGDEFMWEWGWFYSHKLGKIRLTWYFCKECAPDQEKVVKKLEEYYDPSNWTGVGNKKGGTKPKKPDSRPTTNLTPEPPTDGPARHLFITPTDTMTVKSLPKTSDSSEVRKSMPLYNPYSN